MNEHKSQDAVAGEKTVEQLELEERFSHYHWIRRNGVKTNCKYHPSGQAEAHGVAGACNCGGVADRDRISLFNHERSA